jgi:hypothetical protein
VPWYLWKIWYAERYYIIMKLSSVQEKDQKISLTQLKKQKVKLEKQMEATAKIAFPIPDELLTTMDRQGAEPNPLPIPVMKVDVPDEYAFDVLFVWDFTCTFT